MILAQKILFNKTNQTYTIKNNNEGVKCVNFKTAKKSLIIDIIHLLSPPLKKSTKMLFKTLPGQKKRL